MVHVPTYWRAFIYFAEKYLILISLLSFSTSNVANSYASKKRKSSFLHRDWQISINISSESWFYEIREAFVKVCLPSVSAGDASIDLTTWTIFSFMRVRNIPSVRFDKIIPRFHASAYNLRGLTST
jgi:hypothetical protein